MHARSAASWVHPEKLCKTGDVRHVHPVLRMILRHSLEFSSSLKTPDDGMTTPSMAWSLHVLVGLLKPARWEGCHPIKMTKRGPRAGRALQRNPATRFRWQRWRSADSANCQALRRCFYERGGLYDYGRAEKQRKSNDGHETESTTTSSTTTTAVQQQQQPQPQPPPRQPAATFIVFDMLTIHEHSDVALSHSVQWRSQLLEFRKSCLYRPIEF